MDGSVLGLFDDGFEEEGDKERVCVGAKVGMIDGGLKEGLFEEG